MTESAAAVGAVITYHLNPYASGVVRFNELLAKHLGVPFLGLFAAGTSLAGNPLLSFKVSEMSGTDRARFETALDSGPHQYEVFLHEWTDLRLERRLVSAAGRVWCGNDEIRERVGGLNQLVDTVWTPGLLTDRRIYDPAEISVFSFGMAHKIRTDMFGRLRRLLERSDRSYSVFVSSANHETRSVADALAVYREMAEIFPRGLYFLGNLSDVAVYNQLQAATFFAAFFPDGVRANNTSVAAAMEEGSVVITNLDKHSPRQLIHMKNVIDIGSCESLPSDPLTLKRLSLGAMETAGTMSWEALTAEMSEKVSRNKAL